MSVKHEPTEVEINGQTYHVRGDGDPAYLTELAQLVDSRMRSVAAQVPSNDPVRIAILAALNIADEYMRYKNERESTRGIWMEKTQELAERLGRTVAGSQSTEA
jgi:cell division protein ZapA